MSKDYLWKPGKSANPAGRPAVHMWKQIARTAILTQTDFATVARSLVARASNGDEKAVDGLVKLLNDDVRHSEIAMLRQAIAALNKRIKRLEQQLKSNENK